MPGLGSNISKKTVVKSGSSDPLTKVRELEWERKKPSDDVRYGKNIGILGQPMAGKTNMALQYGFFNTKYINYIKEAGYNDVVELLKSGILAEVEKIVVVESENNLRKALNDGVEKALYRPIRDIIDIIPVTIPRKTVVVKNGKVIDINTELLAQVREKYKEVVKGLIDDEGEGTLIIIDSGTKYKKLLDDKLGSIVEKVTGKAHASLDGLDKYSQIFYAYRNTEWEDIMEYMRGFRGWNVTTFKESKTPDWVLEKNPGSKELSQKWVNGTEHFLDIVWRITALPMGDRKVEIVDGQSRYLPSNPEKLRPFKIKLNSRMGAMPLISRMTEKLMLGESEDDEQFW